LRRGTGRSALQAYPCKRQAYVTNDFGGPGLTRYLDSSAFVKRYVQEEGSKAVTSRFERGEAIYTSVLSFPEVHAAIGRKYRDRELSINEKEKLVDEFQADWFFSLSILELTTHTMIALPTLCEQYFLKASDAIHLSAAFWLKDTFRLHAGKALKVAGTSSSLAYLTPVRRGCAQVRFPGIQPRINQIPVSCFRAVSSPSSIGLAMMVWTRSRARRNLPLRRSFVSITSCR